MTMITPSYLGETIEYSSLHACRSTLEDPTPAEWAPATLVVAAAAIVAPALQRSSDSIEEDQVDGAAEQECQARVNQQQGSEVRFDPACGKERPKRGGKHRTDNRAQQPCGKVCTRDIDHRIAGRQRKGSQCQHGDGESGAG